MKNKLLKLTLAFGIVSLLFSCNLDEYNPSAGDGTTNAFTGWYGLQTYCYSPLYSQLFTATDYLSLAEAGTDMWFVRANGNSTRELFYYETLTTSTNATNKVFRQCYSLISSCNTVINQSDKLVDGDPEDIKILTAEAKALRAFYYLTLVTHYGPVTLNLESAEITTFTPKRSSEEEIYKQIVKDLKEAAADLNVTPYRDNIGRVTKKSALGLLARAYTQGAGLELREDGVSYWQKARDVAVDLINNAESYGAFLYDDVSDMWADANNRKNKESLFTAAGPRAGEDEAFNYASGATALFAYTCGNPGSLEEFWNKNHKPSDRGYFYGRMNSSTYMPSKYLMDCFDADWDKRFENSFIHAYSEWSMVQPGWVKYDAGIVTITQQMIDKYDMNPAFLGQKLYPYADCDAIPATYGGNQYPASVWPKGEYSGDVSKLIKDKKKVYVVDYPIDEDDDRFVISLSKEYMSKEDKWKRKYLVINIDDLYTSEGLPHSTPINNTNIHQAYPSFNKFNWSYNGVFMGGNLQRKYGDMFVMRMAEVYLIAAEAELKLGNGGEAAKYLNVLRERAVREGANKEDVKLTSATIEDVFDEYARELCGEFSRWALLKRHKAFEDRLSKYNTRAFSSFKSHHYNRPISYDFLSQISNKEEYGDNGYGTTVNSGL
ncbi:MAG: RagB/SusD family nutrient uptake outer membrane protein [Porphyromonadaceae bacterium]|nr:RagB/SusD family nutrient uptake outer membrane protein [Porphyromonadaceae bacterium]